MSGKTYKIEKTFTGVGSEVRDFEFNQLKEKDGVYIYSVKVSDTSSHYEVFKVKTSPVCINFEKRLYSEEDVKERYPKAKDFGYSAFTLMNLPDAETKFKELSST